MKNILSCYMIFRAKFNHSLLSWMTYIAKIVDSRRGIMPKINGLMS